MIDKAEIKNEDYTILLVDDDSELLYMHQCTLKQAGYNVKVAENGNDAIELLRQGNVDIVGIDYFMKGMSGEEVINKIREFNSEVIIYLQTGYAGQKPPLTMLRCLDIQGYHDKNDGVDKLLILVASAVKVCEQNRRIKQLYNQIEVANKAVEDLRRNQSLLLEESRLSTLGQLCSGVPIRLKFHLKESLNDLKSLERNLERYTTDLIQNKTLSSEVHSEIAERLSKYVTAVRYNLNQISDVIEFIKHKKPIYEGLIESTITQTLLTQRFLWLINSELEESYNCRINMNQNPSGQIEDIEFNGDVTVILQILQNIIMNCAKHFDSKDGGEELAIIEFCPITYAEVVEFVISIKDSYITDESRGEIVEDCKSGGIGLGLFSAQILLKERFGGNVTFEDNGLELVFKVTVPIKRVVGF